MFSVGNLGLHILKCPTGKFTYRGNVPAPLTTTHEATVSDIMAGRSWNDIHTGKVLTSKVKVFNSYDEALQFANEQGFEVLS